MFLNKLIRFHSCVLCGDQAQQADNICKACSQNLPILPHSCRQCAQFLTSASATLCGGCLTASPPFDRTIALFPYENPVIQLIIQLKFKHLLSHAKALGNLLAQKIQNSYEAELLPNLIIPIPLHPTRLRARGFNQALEIARPISKALKIPIDKWGTKRIKNTAAQSGLAAEARKLNITNAFEINRDYSGFHIAVIDDVITTGSTAAEFCKILNQHGAKRIDVWCAARRG